MRRFTAILLYVLLGLSALGGIAEIKGWFSGSNAVQIPDWTKAQVAAEQFTRLYLTADKNYEGRKNELALLAPEAASGAMKATDNTKQIVTSVKARTPYTDSAGRMTIEVDAWTLATRNVLDPESKKMITKQVTRKYLVSVHTTLNAEDPYEGYYISGWPKIWEQNVLKGQERKTDSQLMSVREAIKPMILAVTPMLYRESQTGIENYMLEGTEPRSYYFTNLDSPAVKDMYVSELGEDTYLVEVRVQLKDKLLDSTIIDRVSLEVVKKKDKFYIQRFI